MTIVYDHSPNEVWIAAGSMDDETAPKDWNRVVHICWKDKPAWLQVGEDGLEKIDGAS